MAPCPPCSRAGCRPQLPGRPDIQGQRAWRIGDPGEAGRIPLLQGRRLPRAGCNPELQRHLPEGICGRSAPTLEARAVEPARHLLATSGTAGPCAQREKRYAIAS